MQTTTIGRCPSGLSVFFQIISYHYYYYYYYYRYYYYHFVGPLVARFADNQGLVRIFQIIGNCCNRPQQGLEPIPDLL